LETYIGLQVLEYPSSMLIHFDNFVRYQTCQDDTTHLTASYEEKRHQ